MWGWGDFSSTITITPAGIPGKMDTVTTSIDSSTGHVTISWT